MFRPACEGFILKSPPATLLISANGMVLVKNKRGLFIKKLLSVKTKVFTVNSITKQAEAKKTKHPNINHTIIIPVT